MEIGDGTYCEVTAPFYAGVSSRPVLIPLDHAALFVPVAEHDAVHRPLIHVERMDGWAVRMAMQQDVGA